MTTIMNGSWRGVMMDDIVGKRILPVVRKRAPMTENETAKSAYEIVVAVEILYTT